ncbi:pathogenicity island protein [Staphylococcus coagulans]|uniref:pathogenicity island protein n=1 Tax=Staphylococcus coagulans TaxID=74706 RepID=UPI003364B98E
MKRINKTLIYRVAKITEWQLLTDFNPFYVSKKIDHINDYIESMYHLNTSVVHYDPTHGTSSASYPIDKLAEHIIEQKEALKRYKRKTSAMIAMLNKVIATYSLEDRKQIIKYMCTGSKYNACDAIERLQEEFILDLL